MASRMMQTYFLFLGHSLNDWNLRVILRRPNGRLRAAHAVVLDRQYEATVRRRGSNPRAPAFAYLATFVGVQIAGAR
jgi:hypothetical protein